MVKLTQTIRRQKSTNCLSVFDHFVEFALKGCTIEVISVLTNLFQSLVSMFFEKRVVKNHFIDKIFETKPGFCVK